MTDTATPHPEASAGEQDELPPTEAARDFEWLKFYIFGPLSLSEEEEAAMNRILSRLAAPSAPVGGVEEPCTCGADRGPFKHSCPDHGHLAARPAVAPPSDEYVKREELEYVRDEERERWEGATAQLRRELQSMTAMRDALLAAASAVEATRPPPHIVLAVAPTRASVEAAIDCRNWPVTRLEWTADQYADLFREWLGESPEPQVNVPRDILANCAALLALYVPDVTGAVGHGITNAADDTELFTLQESVRRIVCYLTPPSAPVGPITDAMALAAMREHAAQMGESFDAMWEQLGDKSRDDLLAEWRAILASALAVSAPVGGVEEQALDDLVLRNLNASFPIDGDWHIDATLNGSAAVVIGKEIARWFKEQNAPNYVEIKMMDSETHEVYVLTVQRANGKTPHELRVEAENALAALAPPVPVGVEEQGCYTAEYSDYRGGWTIYDGRDDKHHGLNIGVVIDERDALNLCAMLNRAARPAVAPPSDAGKAAAMYVKECDRLRQENERILAQNAAMNNQLNESYVRGSVAPPTRTDGPHSIGWLESSQTVAAEPAPPTREPAITHAAKLLREAATDYETTREGVVGFGKELLAAAESLDALVAPTRASVEAAIDRLADLYFDLGEMSPCPAYITKSEETRIARAALLALYVPPVSATDEDKVAAFIRGAEWAAIRYTASGEVGFYATADDAARNIYVPTEAT